MKNSIHPYTKLLLRCVPLPDPKKRWKEEIKVEEGTKVASMKLKKREGCTYRDRCPFSMEKCKKQEPSLNKIKAGHKVACFHHQD